MRSPGMMACQALHRFIVGGLIADVIAVIGSLDVVMGVVDRIAFIQRCPTDQRSGIAPGA